MAIDLVTALRLAGDSNPTIGVARHGTQEGFYALREAQVLWLPTLQAGPSYFHYDYWTRNAKGGVVPSGQGYLYLDSSAILSVDTADALFRPLAARQSARARAASEQGVANQVQLQVALAYLDLLRIYANLVINADTLARAENMARHAEAANQEGLVKSRVSIYRARTEVNLRRQEKIGLEAQAGETSAHLAQLLLLPPTVSLRPAEVAVVPLDLVPPEVPLEDLVATALAHRPELESSQALEAAARVQWRQAQFGPLLPTLYLSYLGGYYGGGRNDAIPYFNNRAVGTAEVYWQLSSLGLGDWYHAHRLHESVNGANQHTLEVRAQVAAEVAAAAQRSQAQQRTLASAQEAVRQAMEWWQQLEVDDGPSKLDGPSTQETLETLIAEQAVDQARTKYLQVVIDYNKAQFQLYTALGQPPLEALPRAVPIKLPIPVLPRDIPAAEPLLVAPVSLPQQKKY